MCRVCPYVRAQRDSSSIICTSLALSLIFSLTAVQDWWLAPLSDAARARRYASHA